MYDVIIIGAGPGGIFSAYELMKQDENLKIAVFDAGHSLEQRHCPIDGEKVKSCISCKTCAIMNGFGGAGAFSDGKYNITNDFGGTLYEYIGRQKALELMKYVDTINMSHGGEGTKMYSTAGTDLKKVCLQNKLKLLDASVRHLGTDVNYVVLKNLYDEMKDHMDFFFDTPVEKIQVKEDGYTVSAKDAEYACRKCIVSVGRSGSKWMETVCEDLEIPTKSNRVDIGVRVELPAVIFSHLTDELYETIIQALAIQSQSKDWTKENGQYVPNGSTWLNGKRWEDEVKQSSQSRHNGFSTTDYLAGVELDEFGQATI